MRTATTVFLLLSLLCGLVYPLAATGLAQCLAPARASGSLVRAHGQVVGSALIGQPFDAPGYLWGRPSATKTPSTAYQLDGSAGSSGSNLGPTSDELQVAVRARIERLHAAAAAVGASPALPVPVDLVTTSASGLDPHLSLAAADYQCERIARARRVTTAQVQQALAKATSGRQFGGLGEPVVNVLAANLALDEAFGPPERR